MQSNISFQFVAKTKREKKKQEDCAFCGLFKSII
jgi:hypothetical protein